jgi:hypothetical protein
MSPTVDGNELLDNDGGNSPKLYTVSKLLQAANALLPMLVTLLGIVTAVKLLQALNV